MCLCEPAVARKGCPITLELEVQAAVSHLQWLLIAMAELQSSERPARAFNIEPSLGPLLFFCDLD